ncbi:MAG: hypothetical protein V4501_12830 [Pseudomonadota bacterium]
MDPRIFKTHSDHIAHQGRLGFIENMIKAPIATWIAKDPEYRIQLLKKAISNSFTPEMQDYEKLPNMIKETLKDPQKFLRSVTVDNPEQTMKTLVEQASITAITEYMNTHPEYEEKLNKEEQEAESVKKTSQSRDDKIGKDDKIVPNVSQSQPHHHPSDVVTKADLPPSRSPKVR